MFELSKLFWMLVEPGTLFTLAFLLATILLWTAWCRAGRWLITVLAASGILLALLPLGQWLLVPLENRFPAVREPPADIAGIVVLGGSINPSLSAARGQPVLSGNAERLFAAAALARHYPRARLVFTGGSGNLFEQGLKEAPIARDLFRAHGLGPDIDAGRILFEEQSRNTYENAVLTRRLVAPQSSELWLLVTSANHMPRAVGCFRQAGWRVLPYPVGYRTSGHPAVPNWSNLVNGIGGLSFALKEWLGLGAYYLLGHTDSLFPGPQDPS